MASQLLTTIGNGGISANTLAGFSPATAFLNADGVHAVLSFLNTENDTEVVATPRAVTADNQMATLSVTRAYPIFQVTPGSANVAAGAQVQYTNLGTILKVTPRITANSNIALRVVPEVSNIDSKDQQIINGAVNQANVYAIRRMEAEVVVPSGNTLVMGGLISDSSSKTYNKVPVLGDLPGFGLLFRHDAKTRNKVNLLIFVTPTIIQDTDFQMTQTTFLKSPLPDRPDKDESAWDSGKPYDWNKPVK
jgi:general secretion pathway protein D